MTDPFKERDREENDPTESPFARPNVMTGYPLSPDEKKHVERLAERDDTKNGRQE